jgi:muramoyltetrapeptide carboxypeptidase
MIDSAIAPPRLRPGDRIGVIAPSGPALPAPLARGLEALRGMFRVQVAPSAERPQPPATAPYLTASDEARAAETNALIADPDVRAVIMARGGYGLMRILPLLDAAALRADPKPIVGFSDGTALLSWAHAAGVRGIHGEVAVRLGPERPEAIGEMVRALTDPSPLGRMPWQLRGASNRDAAAVREAIMIPGNLVMASHLVATPWQLPLAGAIWWLEEVGERPYEIDRCLTQLALTRQLDEVAGVVIGDLVRCMDPLPGPGAIDDPASALAVVIERLEHFGLPYLHGAHFGHGRYNPPLPFGARCRFDAQAGTVVILDGAVA